MGKFWKLALFLGSFAPVFAVTFFPIAMAITYKVTGGESRDSFNNTLWVTAWSVAVIHYATALYFAGVCLLSKQRRDDPLWVALILILPIVGCPAYYDKIFSAKTRQ